MPRILLLSAMSLAVLSLSACGDRAEPPAAAEPVADSSPAAAGSGESATAAAASASSASSDAADQGAAVTAFLARITEHCGESFAGKIIANDPPAGEPPISDDPFVGKALIMHVRECGKDQLKIPFHVGDDHSRTWILSRVGADRLELKHDHRHADGSPDTLTFYGGSSADAGSELRQSFPVDQESKELFEREGLQVSMQNVWAMEIEPGKRFLYELARPSGRLFQVEFDLSQPVQTPPVPWGHE
jgi:hypothetical protein